MPTEPIDWIPVWCSFPLAIGLGIIFVECGYRFGAWRHLRESNEKDAPVAAMVASLLGLLAFMLAFTFSMAAGRFDARRHAVADEANSIGTTYLRSDLLSEPERTEANRLLRRYAEVRLKYIAEGKIPELITVSEELHRELWQQARSAAEKAPQSIPVGLFVQSLNQMIDLHSQRVFVGLGSRIPSTIWLSLFGLTLLGLISIGYQAGLAATRRSPEMPMLAVAFAIVLSLIVDLDRGHEGLLRVSQQAMIDLNRSMQNSINNK